MNVGKHSALIFVYILLCMQISYAQIVDFSQVFTNYVYLNPSFVGSTSCPNVYSSFRTRNLSEKSYNSAYVSFDVELNEKFGSVGASLLQDFQSDVFKETAFMAIYAKTFQIRRYLYMNASLAAGYVYGATDYSNLIYSDMLNVFGEGFLATGEDMERIVRHNFNTEMGILLYNDNFFAGVSIKNLQGNITEENKKCNFFPRIFSFHSLGRFSTTKAYTQQYRIWFYPHVNLVVSNVSSYAQLGLVLQKWMVQAGGGYRQNFSKNANSFTFFVGVVQKKFRFAYSCDVTRNTTRKFDTHEVSLGYQFDCREKKKKFEAVKAPTI